MFCKTSSFESIRCNQFEDLDQAFLKSIINQAKKIALLMTNFLFGMDFTVITSLTLFIFHLASIKLKAILVIIYQLTH